MMDKINNQDDLLKLSHEQIKNIQEKGYTHVLLPGGMVKKITANDLVFKSDEILDIENKWLLDGINLLMDFFKGDDEKVKQWLHYPNALLGGITPAKMAEEGRSWKLLEFIKSSIEDNSIGK